MLEIILYRLAMTLKRHKQQKEEVVAQAPTKRPELFSRKALQLWSFALTVTVQNETDKARTAYRN
jgi:hypothetical protein